METEVHKLYMVLNSYNHSIVKVLNKIDESVLQAVHSLENTNTNDFIDKKQKISLEIVSVLETYMTILHKAEKEAKEVIPKLSELENDSQPQRETRVWNPFIASLPKEPSQTYDRVPERAIEPSSFSFEPELDTDDESVRTVVTESETPRDGSGQLAPISTDCSVEEVKFETPLIDLATGDASDFSESSTSSAEGEVELIVHQVQEDPSFKTKNLVEPEKKEQSDEGELARSVKNEQSEVSEPSCENAAPLKNEGANRCTVIRPKCKVTFEASPPQLRKEINAESPNVNQRGWRKEAFEIFGNTSPKDFAWKTAPVKNQIQKKEKSAFHEILDGKLYVGAICTFCHIETPSEFYVQTDENMLIELENHANDYMNTHHQYVVNKYKSKMEAKKHLGNFCFVYLTDRRKWFRVEILDWLEEDPDNEEIFLQLIDYGETLPWTYKNLKPMTESFSMFPKLAVRCHLAAIYSTHPQSKTLWKKTSTDYFIRLTEMTKFKAIFAFKERNSYSSDFIRVHEEMTDPDSLGLLLVKGGYAFEVQIKSEDPLDTLQEEDLDDFDNINEAVAGYDARDEARICPFTDRMGRCFKGARCKLEHGQLSRDGITTDKIPVRNQAFATVVLPLTGAEVEVMISGYIDTCHFYVHFLRNRSRGMYNDAFENLREAMKVNNVVQMYEPLKMIPSLSELVLVKEGLEWFRGTCVGFTDDGDIEVFFVDFGHKRIKKLKELKQMREDFLYVPFQAVECILSECQEKKGINEFDSKLFFDKCMAGQTLKGVMVDSSCEPVSLALLEPNGLMDLSHVLKKCGLAEDRVKDLRPAKNSIICSE